MATQIAGRSIRSNTVGFKVDRAAGSLPATTNAALFTVAGGRILLTGIVGTVTTAIQAQANTLSLSTNSTTGNITTALTTGVDVNAAAVGNLYGIDGVRGNAAVLGSSVYTANELVVAIGTIRWVTTATSTGAMSWSLLYIPLDDGAYVTAA